MGTITILQYARLYPGHTAALVLVDGSIPMATDVPRDKMLPAAKQYGESTKAREAMVQKMLTPNTTEEVRKQVLAMTMAVAARPIVGRVDVVGDVRSRHAVASSRFL
jgi:pimeloyl-ACP methyl ester carboxylesterase